MTDDQIIQLIRENKHSQALDLLYNNYEGFKNAFKKSGGSEADAEDIFQEGLYILIRKVSSKEFQLSCKLNTFLFSICRNLVNGYFSKANRKPTGVLMEDIEMVDVDLQEVLEKEDKLAKIEKVIAGIGTKCKEMLTAFYYYGLSMVEIAQKQGFKNENSAKTQKYKCIEQAKKMVENVVVESKIDWV